MGISGRIAKLSLNNPITPLFGIMIVILGLIAILITPKEEDPQINVTMVDVFISAPGLSSGEVEQQISIKAENAMSQMAGVEDVYSVSMQGRSVITVQFTVGIKRQEALVKTWNQVMTELYWPSQYGVGQTAVRARGINDVPIVSLTFWSDDPNVSQTQVGQVATSVSQVLQRVEGSRNIETVGYAQNAVNVKIDPVKAAAFGVDVRAVLSAMQQFGGHSPELPIQTDNKDVVVAIGQFLTSEQDVKDLVVFSKLDSKKDAQGTKLVYLRDIADISLSSIKPTSYVQMGFGQASVESTGLHSAVTLSVAKQEGRNAIDVANAVLDTAEALKGKIIPDNIQYSVTRNSGLTAQQKANKLIQKLLFATMAVVVLVLFFLGKRAAIIVGLAVGLTLLITLFSSWAWGFTLNRISLFALIFSIGILVDDAIVVVENIHRRQHSHPEESLVELIPKAVDEVGGSTILATFTVIAALLPMAFVSGLMGPYMSPIPINASTGMLLSLVIAFTITPWLAVRLLKGEHKDDNTDDKTVVGDNNAQDKESGDIIGRIAGNFLSKFITAKDSLTNQWKLFAGIVILMIAVMVLPVTGLVLLKMLPFDNKATMEIAVDMPEGTTVETTLAALQEMSSELAKQDYVVNYQLYAGTNAPITFNGLVRQYYMRAMSHQGEITLTIVGNKERDEGSHDLAKQMRSLLLPIANKLNANFKMVEEPSGPPTLAPIVAEVYGPDQASREQTASALLNAFNTTDEIVDTDTTIAAQQVKWQVVINEQRAQQLGIVKSQAQSMLYQLLSEDPIGYLHDRLGNTPTPIIVSADVSYKANMQAWLNTKMANDQGLLVPLSEFVEIVQVTQDQPIYHKNLRPVIYVMADMAGETDSPLYGMFEAGASFSEQNPGVEIFYTQAPDQAYTNAIKWDGEWQITYETFRDMGIAYGVGLLLIYLLIVGQFKNYRLPLIIMAPIPLTMIGIFPGHWIMDAKFTAPSMIGMIALAGIIVRNSILLVDFIEQQLAQGVDLKDAVVASAQMRARPIILTALAAMIGALFILSDPIFKGLAVSLIFGMAVSSVLTLVVIPIAYYRSKKDKSEL
ncbi:efflux RND transporter permease subunit [uncultured Psychrosphaera sp.]|uniref:efflux RND transporter permease subunit n=1 Tax=uncultured Psychrosphaera sp. TaxID=1403522 RepID=UPI002622762B|nr:efflux RND transporter permease subunit [uncultured Psychrosphaera sp.]